MLIQSLGCFPEGSWPELLVALFQASKSSDSSHREGAFRIFATTPNIIGKQHAADVRGAFISGFQDEALNVGYLHMPI